MERKRVSAIIKPFRLDPVLEAIAPLGADALTVTEVRGYGRQKGHLELYSGAEYSITFLPKIKIDFLIDADRLEAAVEGIARAARTGRIGDGKIFVRSVVERS
ncbi:MAG: P-II family nitrogen regulator [Planctomycetes bacterium]|nr:P-II family nitrogen regulator [Planctomycetota bacterium]